MSSRPSSWAAQIVFRLTPKHDPSRSYQAPTRTKSARMPEQDMRRSSTETAPRDLKCIPAWSATPGVVGAERPHVWSCQNHTCNTPPTQQTSQFAETLCQKRTRWPMPKHCASCSAPYNCASNALSCAQHRAAPKPQRDAQRCGRVTANKVKENLAVF